MPQITPSLSLPNNAWIHGGFVDTKERASGGIPMKNVVAKNSNFIAFAASPCIPELAISEKMLIMKPAKRKKPDCFFIPTLQSKSTTKMMSYEKNAHAIKKPQLFIGAFNLFHQCITEEIQLIKHFAGTKHDAEQGIFCHFDRKLCFF